MARRFVFGGRKRPSPPRSVHQMHFFESRESGRSHNGEYGTSLLDPRFDDLDKPIVAYLDDNARHAMLERDEMF